MMFTLDAFWQAEASAHMACAKASFDGLQDDFSAMLDAAVACVEGGGKIIFLGNGGSAADAQHLAAELTIRYKQDRVPIASLALTTDSSALTACGNDLGFDEVFARQLAAVGRQGDLVIAISTSGNSANIVRALDVAKDIGAASVGWSGQDGGKMVALCDHMIRVPSDVTARIQEMHITIGHMFCGALEQRLGLV